MTNIPKESQLRDILNKVGSEHYRGIFTSLLDKLRRDKHLASYRLPLTPHGVYYVAVDGSQYHSSRNIHCEHCLRKEYKSGTEYQHQVLQAAEMHHDYRPVIPLMPQAISNHGTHTKQDCESQAMKRFLLQLKKTQPRFPFLIGDDSLFTDSPTITLITSLKMHYLLTCKPGDHKYMFSWLNDFTDWPWTQWQDKQGKTHRYRWRNDGPLMDSEQAPRVNYLEYESLNKGGKVTYHGGWVTNIEVTRSKIEHLVRTARCRWKIENECFNTLKNQGYQMTHNFGHGKQHLS
jgi:hypothetical protein